MNSYLQLLQHVLDKGVLSNNRTGTDTLSVFGYQWRHNMEDGFPLLTTKQMQVRSIIYELLWFLRGEDHIKFLKEHNVHIWDNWANEGGFVGPMYGSQWRKWNTALGPLDQIKVLIHNLKTDPNSRRLLVSAWNVSDLSKMAIPPCHFGFQCVVKNGVLNLHFFMRSADAFLGLPFDIASYAFLLCMLAHQTNLTPGELVCSITDLHLYVNHVEQAKEQLTRKPYSLPTFEFIENAPNSIDSYAYCDLFSGLRDYQSWPAIKAPIAI